MSTMRIPLLLIAATLLAADNGYNLFQRGLAKERADADPRAAIRIYEQVLQDKSVDRKLAAQALLRMAECHQKLGDAEARKIYERLLREYPDQTEAVATARARLGTAPQTTGVVTRQLWVGPDRDDYVGAVSADGRLLPYTDSATGDLAIRVLATGETRRLTNKGPWTVSKEGAEWPGVISADGRTVAYGWMGKDSFELRTIPVAGGEPRVLVRNAEIAEIEPTAWSSDAAYLVCIVRRKDRNNQIALVSSFDGSLRTLKSLEWRYPSKVCLSPDNRQIIYDAPARPTETQRDIFLLTTDAGRESVVVGHAADDYGPLWAPDGGKVVFLSNRSGETELWITGVQGDEAQRTPQLVKAGLVGRKLRKPLGFSRDGSYYYLDGVGTSDVYVAEYDAETAKLLQTPSRLSERYVGRNIDPVLSPDGKYVAFWSLRTSGSATVVRSFESGEERDVAFEGAPPGPQVWLRDNRSLLRLGTDPDRRQGIYRLEVDTGKVKRLLQFRSGEISRSLQPAVSPDGATVYYVAKPPELKEQTLRAFDIQSGRERDLGIRFPGGGRTSLAVSVDGRRLAVAIDTGDARALFLAPADGGQERQLLRTLRLQPHLGLAWTPDSRHVLYISSSESGEAELWRVSVENGANEKIALPLNGLRRVGAHPDGRHLVFSGGNGQSRKREIWRIENLLPSLRASK